MKLYTLMLPLALAIAYCCTSSQAVVHGIQAHSSNYETANSNQNGYRYNGPAHKYLPAISAPTTEAIVTTGHWQPSPMQVNYEYPTTQQGLYQQGYNGPYSMQHYDRKQQMPSASWQQEQNGGRQQQQQQQQTMTNFNNNFPYAPTQKPTSAPTTLGQFSASYGLSAEANYGRYMEPNFVDKLMTQALPEPNQLHMFAEPEQTKYKPELSGAHYVQMQSQSFELPSFSSMHKEWPEQQQKHQQQQQLQQQQQHLQQQQQQQQQQYHHSQTQSHMSAAVQRPSLQFRPDREEAYQYPSAQGQDYEHYSNAQQQHYMQPNSIFGSQSHSPAYSTSSTSPSASSSSSTSSTQSSHLSTPSREFLAPYY